MVSSCVDLFSFFRFSICFLFWFFFKKVEVVFLKNLIFKLEYSVGLVYGFRRKGWFGVVAY